MTVECQYREQPRLTKQDVIDRYDDWKADDPTLTEVLRVFDPEDLTLDKHYKVGWILCYGGGCHSGERLWSTRRLTSAEATLFRYVGVDIR